MFDVSQLKVAVPVTHTVQRLPSSLDGLQVPKRVLQKRVTKVGTNVCLQALIQWSECHQLWRLGKTWRLRASAFLEHLLGGKQVLIGEGMSATVLLQPQV